MVSVVPHRGPALTGRKTGLAAPRRSGDRGVQRRAPVPAPILSLPDARSGPDERRVAGFPPYVLLSSVGNPPFGTLEVGSGHPESGTHALRRAIGSPEDVEAAEDPQEPALLLEKIAPRRVLTYAPVRRAPLPYILSRVTLLVVPAVVVRCDPPLRPRQVRAVDAGAQASDHPAVHDGLRESCVLEHESKPRLHR